MSICLELSFSYYFCFLDHVIWGDFCLFVWFEGPWKDVKTMRVCSGFSLIFLCIHLNINIHIRICSNFHKIYQSTFLLRWVCLFSASQKTLNTPSMVTFGIFAVCALELDFSVSSHSLSHRFYLKNMSHCRFVFCIWFFSTMFFYGLPINLFLHFYFLLFFQFLSSSSKDWNRVLVFVRT